MKGYVAPSQDRGFVRNPGRTYFIPTKSFAYMVVTQESVAELNAALPGARDGGDKATSTTAAIALRL